MPTNVNAWATLAAILVVSINVATLPSAAESLYWQTGSITYLLPIVLGSAYVATVWRIMQVWQRRRAREAWITVSLALIVLGVGCSETAMAVLVGGLALSLLALVAFYHGCHRRGLLAVVGAAAFVGLCAAAVVIMAPGNGARGTHFDHPPLGLALLETIWFPFLAVSNLLIHAPIYAVLAYAVPFLVAHRSPEVGDVSAATHLLRQRRLVMLGGVLLIAAAGAPSFYIGGGAPPPRAQIIPQFVLIACLLSCGLLDGLARRRTSPASSATSWQRVRLALATALLVLGPIATAARTVGSTAELQVYAAGRDQLDHTARGAATSGDWSPTVPRVPAPALLGADDVDPDPTTDSNLCIAKYYGLRSIQTAAAAT